MEPNPAKLGLLPPQITTPGDLNRLIREVDKLDDFLIQTSLRNTEETPRLPATSRVLEEFAAANSFQLLKPEDRKTFRALLGKLKEEAPTIHISFVVTPSPAFLNKLIIWFRSNIHRDLLLKVGLEPSIAGGCIIRTTNKQFDLSFRRHFIDQHNTLVNELTGMKSSS